MAILFNEKNKIFNIQTKNSSLVFGIYEDKLPVMLHYGKRLKDTYSIEINDLDVLAKKKRVILTVVKTTTFSQN